VVIDMRSAGNIAKVSSTDDVESAKEKQIFRSKITAQLPSIFSRLLSNSLSSRFTAIATKEAKEWQKLCTPKCTRK
jgi:hypothetical protein